MRKVYQFGLRPPSEGDLLVRRQLRAAHDYQNDLVAIERGRRSALRAVDDTDDVRVAVELLKAATKSTRKAAVTALREARKEARAEAAASLSRISDLDASIRKDARWGTPTFWGTYLDIEARHQQSRAQPLYGDDAITPNDPAFAQGPRWRDALGPDDPRAVWWLTDGQVGVQCQGGLATSKALQCTDSRVRLELGAPGRRGCRYGTLRLRVGSDGRDPVWAAWPIKCHRAIPDSAVWKWVRVSLHRDGMRERWTCEITVDDAAPRPRDLDRHLTGTIAVEWEWSPVEGQGIRVARWVDDRGGTGEVVLPERVAGGIRKPDGIRAVRDLVLNDAQPRLARALRETKGPLPTWLREASNVLHLWRSHDRFRSLAMRWRRECPVVAPDAYAILRAWEARDAHLYYYEVGARGEALRERRDIYRNLAARWARAYRTALLSDQDLSREAKFGDDADVRFTAGVSELRQAARQAFGDEDAIDAVWRDKPGEDDERLWCERTRDAWMAGGARGDGRFAERKEVTANAWAARKAKAARKRAEKEAAREPGANDAKRQAP
jgi:hypothetical protein